MSTTRSTDDPEIGFLGSNPISLEVRHEEDPNGYAGVRGRVAADIPIGSPIRLILADPWGNTWTGVAGDKPEYGKNGFGWIVNHAGDYTLTLKQRLQQETIPVPIRGGEMTVLEIGFLGKNPISEEPISEEPPAPPAGPPDVADLLVRLDRIIALLVKHDEKHTA